jgi:hypothetical protein
LAQPVTTSSAPSRFIGSFFFDFFHPFVATAARRWIASQEAQYRHPPSGDGGYRKRLVRSSLISAISS